MSARGRLPVLPPALKIADMRKPRYARQSTAWTSHMLWIAPPLPVVANNGQAGLNGAKKGASGSLAGQNRMVNGAKPVSSIIARLIVHSRIQDRRERPTHRNAERLGTIHSAGLASAWLYSHRRIRPSKMWKAIRQHFVAPNQPVYAYQMVGLLPVFIFSWAIPPCAVFPAVGNVMSDGKLPKSIGGKWSTLFCSASQHSYVERID